MSLSIEEWEEEMKADAAQDAQDAKEEAALHDSFGLAWQRLVLDNSDLDEATDLLNGIVKTMGDYGWNITINDIMEQI